jgi:methionyl-tRNA synthetase
MERKNIYIIAATFRDKHILRFVVCSRMTESRDIAFAWEEIRSQADRVLHGDTLLHFSKTQSHIKRNGVRKDCLNNGITNGQG